MRTTLHVQLLLVIAVMAFSGSSMAQMGIRYGIQHEKTTQAKQGSDWNMLLGWDFDHNERLSGGLDFTSDVNFGSAFNMPSSNTSGPTFYEKVKVLGMQYRSQFHFADNDGGNSFYLGPTIGLRWVKHKINYYQETNNGWTYSSDLVESEETAMIFPVGMRVGVRGPLDGGYGDLFIAIGTNIGSGDVPVNDVRTLTGEAMPNKVFFQAGVCYGVGW